jgi:type II secretory ATPase GspE/PulE/Tfp pilus assembly ATPase PilB-like protein
MKQQKIGQIFLQKGYCREEDIEKALGIQETYGGKIGTILLNMGILTEEQLLSCLAEQLDIEYRGDVKDLSPIEIDVKKSLLRDHAIYPFGESDQYLDVLTNNPLNTAAFALLESMVGKRVRPVLAREENLKHFASIYEDANILDGRRSVLNIDDEIDRLKELASEAPVIKLVNNLLSVAAEKNASDIHFEAMRGIMRVRFRVDGVLQSAEIIQETLKLAVIARLKLLSGMNIAENRLPQDGRISVRIAGKEIDIRASSVPTQFGESFVLRLLGKEAIDYSLESLGFFPDHIETIRELLKEPNGIFLTTGPTGSGKTTTLYSMLKELTSEEVKIVTVEDPVEYEFKGVNQINVRTDIGYTFASSLRSILRQDPDIIMVGEIRDVETAEISIQAALTGHLVLSTLHTNSALASITRLLDMGVEHFLLKASVMGVMAQRLVRKLCPHCARPASLPEAIERKFQIPNLLRDYPFAALDYREAAGCAHCNETGYKGRMVIAEVVPLSLDAHHKFELNSSFSALGELGCRSMLQDGLLKAVQGKTTVDEVLRVAS